MGGFHIALNYLSFLGKKYANSRLEDLPIESGVYAAGTVISGQLPARHITRIGQFLQ